MGTKLNVNTTVVEEQIKVLKEALNKLVEEDEKVEEEGSGLAKENESLNYSEMYRIKTEVANLMSCTIATLENMKDGYLENDTYDAEQIKRYRG